MNDRYGDAEAEARDSGEDAPSLCDFSPSPLRMSSAVELGHEPDGPPDVPEFPDLVSREDENRVAAWVLTSPREARQLFLVVSPSDFVFVVPRAVTRFFVALEAFVLDRTGVLALTFAVEPVRFLAPVFPCFCPSRVDASARVAWAAA